MPSDVPFSAAGLLLPAVASYRTVPSTQLRFSLHNSCAISLSPAHSAAPLQPGHQRRQRRPARAPRPTPPSPQCHLLNTYHPHRSPDHPHRHPFLLPKEGLPPVEGFLLVGLSEGAPRCPWHEGAYRRRPGRRVCARVAARSGATAGLRRGGRRERSPAASPASFPSAVARARVVQLRGSAAKT